MVVALPALLMLFLLAGWLLGELTHNRPLRLGAGSVLLLAAAVMSVAAVWLAVTSTLRTSIEITGATTRWAEAMRTALENGHAEAVHAELRSDELGLNETYESPSFIRSLEESIARLKASTAAAEPPEPPTPPPPPGP